MAEKWRSSPKCSVKPFKHGSNLTIDSLILQMKTYYFAANSLYEKLVGEIIHCIDTKHFYKIVSYVSLDY